MSKPRILPDGTVISSAISVKPKNSVENNLWHNYSLVVGQIVNVYTIDEAGDKHPHGDKPFATAYDILIVNNDDSTETLVGCRSMQPVFGGEINNFQEFIPNPVDKAEMEDVEIERRNQAGHFVLVGFVNGNKSKAVIIGSMPHANDAAKARRPKKEVKKKGAYLEGEIQGLNYKVDNEGAFTLTFQGPKEDKKQNRGKHRRKEFKGEEKEQKSDLKDDSGQNDFSGKDAPTVIHINKDGNVTLTNNVKQRVHVDRVNKTIRIDNDKTYINMIQGDDGAAKVSIVANQVDIGHANQDTVGSMSGGNQDLQPMVVGDDWQFFMEELIKEIMLIYVPTGTGPSGNPVNNPKFQALMKRLPEVLSKKHKVEK